MADLTETPVFDAGIRQIETTDPVVGGAPNIDSGAGISNIPHLQLARRTLWLRDRIDDIDIAATTVARGFVELATNAEAQAGTDATRAVTPAAAKSAFLEIDMGNATASSAATTSKSGLVELATSAEALAGTDITRALTPGTAAAAFLEIDLGNASAASNATTAKSGLVELATDAEALAGSDTTRAVTPAAAKSAFLQIGMGNATAASNATTTARGLVELATNAEAQAGSDTTRGLTPAAAAATFLRRDLGSASALTSGNDLNAVTTPGFYYWLTSNPVNRPAGVTNAKLIVETVGADIVQMVWGGSEQQIHTRRRTSGAWSTWNRMWSDTDATFVTTPAGYRIAPDGFIIQWGSIAYPDIVANLTVPLSYPISFPTHLFSASAIADTPQSGVTVSIKDTTLSGLNFVLKEHSEEITGGEIRWIVMGR